MGIKNLFCAKSIVIDSGDETEWGRWLTNKKQTNISFKPVRCYSGAGQSGLMRDYGNEGGGSRI